MPPRLSERRRDGPDYYGSIRKMASADGYVMVRRPGCTPFIMSEQAWLSLPLDSPAGRAALERRDG